MPSSLIVRSSLKFDALAVYLHPTFTASFHSEVNLKPSQTSAVEFFAEIVDIFRSLAIFLEEVHRGCLTRFYMRLCPITYYS